MSGKIWNSTLTRKKPLRAKKPIWMRSRNTPEVKDKFRHSPAFMERKPIRKVSKSHAARLKKYYEIRKEYLERFPVCGICLVLGEEARPATEIHHSRGRNSLLLMDTRFFVPSCRHHRDFPHDNPRRARELGILAEPAEWNVVPR